MRFPLKFMFLATAWVAIATLLVRWFIYECATADDEWCFDPGAVVLLHVVTQWVGFAVIELAHKRGSTDA